MNVSKKFWKNKKVFVTGHTGFKGSYQVAFYGEIPEGPSKVYYKNGQLREKGNYQDGKILGCQDTIFSLFSKN